MILDDLLEKYNSIEDIKSEKIIESFSFHLATHFRYDTRYYRDGVFYYDEHKKEIEFINYLLSLYPENLKLNKKAVIKDIEGSVNIENAKLNDVKTALANNGIALNRGMQMYKSLKSAYSLMPVNVDNSDVIKSVWDKIVYKCCENEEIRGEKYRTDLVRVGEFVPIKAEGIAACVEWAIDSLKDVENSILRAVLYHYLIAFIHPFCDGNGRTARFMMQNELVKYNERFRNISVSWGIFKTRWLYYSVLSDVLRYTNLNIFIDYMLNVIKGCLVQDLIDLGIIQLNEEEKLDYNYIMNKEKIDLYDIDYVEKTENLVAFENFMSKAKIVGLVIENNKYYHVIFGGKNE